MTLLIQTLHNGEWQKHALYSYCSNILKLKIENNSGLIYPGIYGTNGSYIDLTDNVFCVFDIDIIIIRLSIFVILYFLCHLYRYTMKSNQFKIKSDIKFSFEHLSLKFGMILIHWYQQDFVWDWRSWLTCFNQCNAFQKITARCQTVM